MFCSMVSECKVQKPVWTTPKSEITLPCPELLNVKWEVLHNDKSTEITKYECKHTEKTEGATKPLCERSKIVKTSLIIRDVVNSDALWYRCRGNKTCYDVKLNVKGMSFNGIFQNQKPFMVLTLFKDRLYCSVM